MSNAITVNAEQIQQWVANKHEVSRVQEELHSLGLDAESIEAHIKEFKKAKYAKQQYKGFIFLVVGAVMGFISCVLSMTNPFPELYFFILYGFTSASVLVICYGLYLVFE
ncbi:MAG: hypothetical protein IPP51_17960 [Bacteroidetes bacterium]|nr:hypothetical protein [Bacteroidota bacterium]